MTYFKHIFFVIIPMVIGSFKASASLPLPMASSENGCLNALTEREFMLTSDSIMLIGFLLWVAYIVFCFPKNTLNKR